MSAQITKTGLLLIAVSYCFSCNHWSAVEKLEAEVIAIHDVPMMKLDELETLQNQAGKLLATADSTKRQELEAYITEAQAAHDAMFDWMGQYHAPEEGQMDEKSAIDYLNKQKLTAQSMRDKVLTAIADGKKLLTDK